MSFAQFIKELFVVRIDCFHFNIVCLLFQHEDNAEKVKRIDIALVLFIGLGEPLVWSFWIIISPVLEIS